MRQNKNTFVTVAFSIASLFVTTPAAIVRAQSQDSSAPSVAEAARRTREQKKSTAKPVRTVTNDDLPAAPPAGSSAGSAQRAPANTAEAGAPSTDGAGTAPTTPASDEQAAKQKKTESAAALERARKELAVAEKELDVMQRKAALDADSYYSKPDFANDKDGKANLDAEAQQINDKKQAVDGIKARVAELQALVDEEPPAEPDKNAPPR